MGHTEFPEEPELPEVLKAPGMTTRKKISALQFERLENTIKVMQRVGNPRIYMNGAIFLEKNSDGLKFLKLNAISTKTGAKSSAKSFEIAQFPAPDLRAYTKPEPTQITEHSVCDLYLKACELIPGYQKVSARPLQITTRRLQTPLAPSPVPYDGQEPALQFKESDFMRLKAMKPSELLHVLGIGGTGSGKTASLVRPLLDSMLQYRLQDGKVFSALVIDPKAELLTSVTNTLKSLNESDRLMIIGQCPPIRFFSESDAYSIADRYEKLKTFSGVRMNGDFDDKWQRFADQLIMSMLTDDQRFYDATQLPFFESLCALIHCDASFLKIPQWAALLELFQYGMNGMNCLRHLSDCYDVLTHCVGLERSARPISRYAGMNDHGSEQWFYNSRGALGVIEPVASKDIEPLLDLSVRRGMTRANTCSIEDAIHSGRVLLFQPSDRASHQLAGKALKSLFFQKVMSRKEMLRPVAYVCDEWQRYITDDEESGDHNFLDRCRAYRVNALVATQSIAALQIAMGSDNKARDAVTSLLINLPTKIVFRTPCLQTVEAMMGYIPKDPGGDAHILQCRPPSNLQTGEYFYTNARDWGRSRHTLPKPHYLAPGEAK